MTELYKPYNGNIPPRVQIGDLNGDGLADFLWVGTSGNGYPLSAATSTGSGLATIGVTGPSGSGCYYGNFDGSGRIGVACLAGGSISYAAPTGSGFAGTITETLSGNNIWAPTAVTLNSSPNPCLVMDVNGDGRDDIVCGTPQFTGPPIPTSSTAWGVYLATGALSSTNAFQYKVWNGPTGGYTQTRYCLIGDFNGDGLEDLACMYNDTSGSWTMLLSSGVGWSSQTWAGPTTALQFFGCYGQNQYTQLCPNPCVPGDFDGDGVTDIACPQSNGISWQVALGGGANKFKSISTWAGQAGTWGPSCIAKDLFGTGRTGLLCDAGTAKASNTINWFYNASIGSGFSVTGFSTTWPSYSSVTAVDLLCWFVDINGDGIIDLACHASYAVPANANLGNNWYVALSVKPK